MFRKKSAEIGRWFLVNILLEKHVIMLEIAKGLDYAEKKIVEKGVLLVKKSIVRRCVHYFGITHVSIFRNLPMFVMYVPYVGNVSWIEHTIFHIKLMQWQKEDIPKPEVNCKFAVKN